MIRTPKQIVVSMLVVSMLATWLIAATVTLAACPNEQVVRCASFNHTVKRRHNRVSRITMGLDVRPTCAYARGLIIRWLNHPGDRIYDPAYATYWFKAGTNPLLFTAGLCGYLRFRV